MCGIIGYKGNKNSNNVVHEGLKQLEYRGYDSWGIASSLNGEIEIIKDVGQISSVRVEDINLKEAKISIAHTRWATTGKVTKNNAHPHLSNDKKIAVTHNGIIDNYCEIKEKLEKKGFKFFSETDTEVIPNLISFYMQNNGNFITAFEKAIKELKGSYAITVMNKEIIAFARQEPPLILGITEEEFYVASDPIAFTEKTNKVIFLEKGQWGYYDEKINLFDKDNKSLEVTIEKITWKKENKGKENYKHYMLKEINEQKNTIINATKQENIEDTIKIMKNSKKIFLTGCGTSYNACLAGSVFLSQKKIKAIPILASEYKTYTPLFENHDTLIIISQSGETADLMEVVEKAKKEEMQIIGIINSPNSTLWRKSDIVLGMNAGQEIGVASTKAYTSSLTILSQIAGRENNYEIISKYLEKQINKWQKQIKEITPKIEKDLFIIGREEALSYAMETALKIKEIAYLRAEGFAGGELKHGTLALIEENTPVISIATKETRQEIINNALEIKARGGYIIGIDSEKHSCYDYFIECKYPLLSVVPGQLLAYELAISKGYNPDKPRNLAKCVSVK